MQLTYALHARQVMEERGIPPEWVSEPSPRLSDAHATPFDETVERFFLRVPERGSRVLRVAVNTDSDPWRVVSAFFDRSMRGEL